VLCVLFPFCDGWTARESERYTLFFYRLGGGMDGLRLTEAERENGLDWRKEVGMGVEFGEFGRGTGRVGIDGSWLIGV
jgi:hypothetical protein